MPDEPHQVQYLVLVTVDFVTVCLFDKIAGDGNSKEAISLLGFIMKPRVSGRG